MKRARKGCKRCRGTGTDPDSVNGPETCERCGGTVAHDAPQPVTLEPCPHCRREPATLKEMLRISFLQGVERGGLDERARAAAAPGELEALREVAFMAGHVQAMAAAMDPTGTWSEAIDHLGAKLAALDAARKAT